MEAKKFMVAFFMVALLAPMTPLSLAVSNLTVQINPKFYNAGDIVTIKGTAIADAAVHVLVKPTTLDPFSLPDASAGSNGVYSSTYSLPVDAVPGIWTVTVTSGTDEATLAFFVTTVNTEDMADQMITIAEDSATLSSEMINDLKKSGAVLPASVEASMGEGDAALDEAHSLLSEGKDIAALESAQEAMMHYNKALIIALKAAKVGELAEDRKQALENWVERLTSEADRLTAVLANVETEVDLTGITTKITSARATLVEASALISAEKYDEALTKIEGARDDLKEAMSLLKPILMDVRKGLLNKFKLGLRERLEATENDMGKLKGFLSGVRMSEALSRFGRAKGLVDSAETMIQNGEDDDAVDELDAASQELGEGIGEVDDGYSQGMMRTNQIRAQLQVLKEMVEQYQRSGKDASDTLAKIEELQSSLDEGLVMLFNGEVKGANGVFDKARKGGWLDRMTLKGGFMGSGKGSR
jgi:DNA-binding FrmR family transcriptional regulator